jgi:DNA-directed RNA polymerase subunit RPC12/RpoP
MNLLEFIEAYPDKASCRAKFKEYHDHVGVVCPKCGGKAHYWKRDEDYFSTETPAEAKEQSLKRGRGSQKKTKVLVIAESEPVENPKQGKKPHRVGYLKMKVIEDLQKSTINGHVKNLAADMTEIDTDSSNSYVDLKDFVPRHNSQVIPKEKIGEILPWVHIAISNAKRQIINTFHNVKPEFLQKYLDEFCYKFNRRYFGEALFNRLLVACVSYKNEFKYIYDNHIRLLLRVEFARLFTYNLCHENRIKNSYITDN